MDTLAEVIFKGKSSEINLLLLIKELLINYRDARFNYPEDCPFESNDEIIATFKNNNYVDFVVTINAFENFGFKIPNVFVNIGLDNGGIDMLLYFDLKEIERESYQMLIKVLQGGAIPFRDKYRFATVRCQMDNADQNEYYFDGHDFGPLFTRL